MWFSSLFSLKFRPIAILVSSVYVTWVYKTFYSHYTIQVPKEINQKCRQLYDNCKSLRENRPNVFCGFISSILFLLALIGHIVNGTYILFGAYTCELGDCELDRENFNTFEDVWICACFHFLVASARGKKNSHRHIHTRVLHHRPILHSFTKSFHNLD